MKILSPRYSASRRNLLLSLATIPLAGAVLPAFGQPSKENPFAQIEAQIQGRLGVAVLDSGNERTMQYRADERFPLCSTFKLMLVATILKQSVQQKNLLAKHIRYGKKDLVNHSPVTEQHVASGMRIDELCAATIQYSDNAAANLLLKELNGPPAVTAFARSIGDNTFRLDRYEPQMSASVPGDSRDTTTPMAMVQSMQKLILGDTLPPAQRDQLTNWLRGNTTGGEKIRAGVPADWQVADKTGGGDYGTTNDIAILYPPNRAPVFVALYLTQDTKEAKMRPDLLAAATRIIVKSLS